MGKNSLRNQHRAPETNQKLSPMAIIALVVLALKAFLPNQVLQYAWNPIIAYLTPLLQGVTPQMLAAELGVIMPMVVATVLQPKWPKPLRTVVMLLVCVVVGTISSIVKGEIGGVGSASVAESIGYVLVASQTSYKVFWQPFGAADLIEWATTRKRNRNDQEDEEGDNEQ